MNCLFVFDHLNDLIYSKYNSKFCKQINDFATTQGLRNAANTEDGSEDEKLDDNIVVQVFSPIITSQRIMSCQFGNSYTSIQCDDGLNICFDEFMGYLFISMNQDDVLTIKKFLRICITIVRYLCGADVAQLKSSNKIAQTASDLIDSWIVLSATDQSIFIEAVEQLVVNTELSSMTLQILRRSVDKLINNTDSNKIHAMIVVKNKFLSLYSSQNAKELSPQDILFTILLSHTVQACTEITNTEDCINSFQILLAGLDQNPSCLAHIVHILPICPDINLIYLIEIGNKATSASLYETFFHLHTIQTVQMQHDRETLRPAFEHLDSSIKRLLDSLKKIKSHQIESCHKHLAKKWDLIRKKYLDFIKNQSDESLLRAETLGLNLLEDLRELLGLMSVSQSVVYDTQKQTVDVADGVKEQLNSYNDFLKVKVIKNFSLGSDSLTIIKYLEEFPGLVHFLYVDRNNHRVTAPGLESPETGGNDMKLTQQKVWSMVKFSRNHLQDGNLSLMWKDTIFNYSYFLWFEDTSGAPMKPLVYPANSSKALPLPGLLGGDFYEKLKEVCFPKTQPNKIRTYELFCVHLGLVTASCVLEHTRRLAATIWELRGMSGHPIDLL